MDSKYFAEDLAERFEETNSEWESRVAWKPGDLIGKILCEQGGHLPPPQLDIPAQEVPYVVSVDWGGRSKSDTGARGGAWLLYRDLKSLSNTDIQVAFAPVRQEYPDNQNKKEDWIVTGHISPFIISALTPWRATCLYQVSNDHWVNCYLQIRFLTTSRVKARS